MEKIEQHLIRIPLSGVNAFLWMGEGGPTLIDTGYPWTYNTLLDELKAAGIHPSDLQRIIITHCDLDHIGALKGLTLLSDAVVACHTVAAPYITGQKPLPVRHSSSGKLLGWGNRTVTRIYKPFIDEVQELLLDNEKTPEGFRVIFLPGHSPGQIGLYHKEERLFIAADSMINKDGHITLPPGLFTVNEEQARESLARLRKLHLETVCFGHGPCITEDADAKIRAFLDEVSAGR